MLSIVGLSREYCTIDHPKSGQALSLIGLLTEKQEAAPTNNDNSSKIQDSLISLTVAPLCKLYSLFLLNTKLRIDYKNAK